MPFRIKVSLAILAVLVAAFALVPLVVPIAPPPNVRPLADVAGERARYVEVAGVALHHVTWPGASEGTPLLLLHGFPYSTRTFDELGPLLSMAGDVHAIDLPGFGLSERPDPGEAGLRLDPYAPASQPELVAGALLELGLQPAVLVGHGYGARVALDTAVAYPDLVAGVVTLGAAPFTDQRRSWLSRLVMRTPQMERLGPVFLRQLATEPGARILRAGWSDPDGLTQERIDAFLEPFTVQGWDVALWHLSQAEAPPAMAAELGRLSARTLVVVGEDDVVVPTSESERLAASLPSAELLVLPGCGHAVQEECPTELASAILEWLQE